MNRHELQPGELDKIGTRLIASSVLNEIEIDRIADSPFLYSSVKARITSDIPAASNTFGFGRRLTLGFGSLIVVIGLVAVGLFVFRGENTMTSKRPVPAQMAQSEQPDRYSKPGIGDLNSVPGVVMSEEKHSSPQIQNASFSRAEDRNYARKKATPRVQPDLEFYPLVYTGDPKENASGGRVLQVEMSRSSLFAMGFNIPIENGAELVKADLLVGQDGVARAIRLH